jgi:hypothetical protein
MEEAIKQETTKLNKGGLDVDDLVRFIDRISVTPEVETRCTAKRPNDEQCTRRCKAGSQLCGTHSKIIPRGNVDGTITREVVAVNIDGIMHYVSDGLIYRTEDVLRAVVNPAVVGRYTTIDGKFVVEW